MSCATSTLKFFAFICHILCFMFGGLMISASAYALAVFEPNHAIRIPCIVAIVMGSLLFLFTIMGSVGLFRNSIRLTWTYAVLVLILLAAQVAITFFLPVDFGQIASETVNNAWNQELSGSSLMGTYEQTYKCCGRKGPNDYPDSGITIPNSCYVHQNSSVAVDLYPEGCMEVLKEAYADSARIEVISDWSLVAVESITIFMSCMLAISLANTKRRKLYS